MTHFIFPAPLTGQAYERLLPDYDDYLKRTLR